MPVNSKRRGGPGAPRVRSLVAIGHGRRSQRPMRQNAMVFRSGATSNDVPVAFFTASRLVSGAIS